MVPVPTVRRPGAQRAIPIAYAVMAVALAALVLPSILRPPQDQQSTTGAFSADAPPDDTPQDAILQSVQGARSQTAGGAPAEQEVIIEEVVQGGGPPPKPRAAVRNGCFGDPPRQTESLYSHLCVPAFTGKDNGGATWRGVTANEIRIGVAVPADSPVTEGPIAREITAADNAETRQLKVWQTYFNERFELYGRYLQFYAFKVSSSSENAAQASASQASSRHGGVFAMVHQPGTTTAIVTNELVRQKVLTFTSGQNPADFYRNAHPYAYSFTIDSWQTRAIGSELVCKQFANKPPGEFNARRDPSFFYDSPRKFGLLIYQDELRVGAREMYEKGVAKCGVRFEAVQEYNLNTSGAASISAAVSKMRAAGVTTIVLSADPISPAVLTEEATGTGYYPEWVCVTNCEFNEVGRILDEEQADAFVAVGTFEIPREDADRDWYRAHKEIDPDGTPAIEYFRDLQQLAGGMQHAGPKLTPESFWAGLRKQPCRAPEPAWTIGGCYRDPDPRSEIHYVGDYTYSDYASLLWFDQAGDDPQSSSAGAWCWMDGGRRYQVGSIPTEKLPFRDLKRCIHTPERGEQG